MHNDASGEYLAYAILSAADRGVQVRLLVDDIDLGGRDSSLKMLGQHDNIQIRIFNPLVNRDWLRTLELLINHDRAGRRMHNKVFITDGASAIIGGRNIGDEYFDNRENLNFVDLDILIVGPIITEISNSFDTFWNSHWATPVENLSKVTVIKKQLSGIRRRLKDKWHRAKNSHYFQNLQRSDLRQRIIDKDIPFIWADATVFYDPPEKINPDAHHRTTHFGMHFTPYVESAKDELQIASSYFIPGRDGEQWLTKKSQQGIKIKVLTNSLSTTDVIAVHAGYKKYRRNLIRSGITLFELKSTAQTLRSKATKLIKGSSTSSLHAKYMVIDRRYVLIGSANFDPRSNVLNTEIGIMINSRALAEQASALFDRATSAESSYQLAFDKTNKAKAEKIIWRTEEKGREIYFSNEPKASWRKKLGVFLIGLLPIEHLL